MMKAPSNHLVDAPETYAKYLREQRRLDIPAYDKRIKVRFRCAGGRHTLCAQSIKPQRLDEDGCGWVEMLLYESELPMLQQEVETELASVKAAKEAHLLAQRKHIARALGYGNPDDGLPEKNPALARVPGDPREWTQEQRNAERSYSGPAYTMLFRLYHGRCIKTIRSEIEVVEKDIPAPLSREETLQSAQGEAMSIAIARALKEVLSSSSGGDNRSSRKG
jgi:hypothetical protein